VCVLQLNKMNQKLTCVVWEACVRSTQGVWCDLPLGDDAEVTQMVTTFADQQVSTAVSGGYKSFTSTQDN